MFNITELDEMVCSQLDRKSLVQCAKVNKKWNAALMPFIWRTIPKDLWYGNWTSFCNLVLEDFLQEQQRLKNQQPPAKRARKSTQANKSVSEPSAPCENVGSLPLAKYGRFVYQVELSGELLWGLGHVRSTWKELGATRRSSNLSLLDLVRHFLKRCPYALMDLELDHRFFNTPRLFCLSLEILPRVHSLSIKGDHDGRKSFPASKLKQALTAASAHLHTLTIDVLIFRPAKAGSDSVTHARTEPKITARPMRLHLQHLLHFNDCTWLWRIYSQVQELEVCRITDSVLPILLKGMRDSMPSLDTVKFGSSGRDPLYNDEKVARILASGTKGWKAVHCGSVACVGPQAIAAVLKHAATLEEFSVIRVQVSTDITRILKSSPKLRTFEAIDELEYSNSLELGVSGSDFVDWDEEAKVFRPWSCKDTLETLAIKIINVPHWDYQFTYSGPGGVLDFFKIQQKVCERIGTFTNLKALQLAPKSYRSRKQHACVHLSLDSGLDKLASVKKLEKLHINNMGHRVTQVQEVEWMVEHWPKLWRLDGLDRDSKAYKWLKENHPEIQQQPSI